MNIEFNILIADDSNFARKKIVEIIKAKPTHIAYYYKIIEVVNGEEALDVLHKERVDILLLDINMPKVNGIEVINTLKDESIKIPTIVISGDREIKLETLGESLIRKLFYKPCDMNKLWDEILEISEEKIWLKEREANLEKSITNQENNSTKNYNKKNNEVNQKNIEKNKKVKIQQENNEFKLSAKEEVLNSNIKNNRNTENIIENKSKDNIIKNVSAKDEKTKEESLKYEKINDLKEKEDNKVVPNSFNRIKNIKGIKDKVDEIKKENKKSNINNLENREIIENNSNQNYPFEENNNEIDSKIDTKIDTKEHNNETKNLVNNKPISSAKNKKIRLEDIKKELFMDMDENFINNYDYNIENKEKVNNTIDNNSSENRLLKPIERELNAIDEEEDILFDLVDEDIESNNTSSNINSENKIKRNNSNEELLFLLDDEEQVANDLIDLNVEYDDIDILPPINNR